MTSIPLSPKQGGQCILPSALAPADIIVSTTNALISRGIRADTRSSISHVILYAGTGQVVEAVQAGVVARSLNEALKGATVAVAYRYRGLTPRQACIAITYARTKVGLKYDVGGALGGGARANPAVCVVALQPALGIFGAFSACGAAANGKWQNPNRYYCSELVLESFQKAGIHIVPVSPSVSVPEDIVGAYNRGVLEYVGHLR
jgi:cell wall-associated NlpC family hydrolase